MNKKFIILIFFVSNFIASTICFASVDASKQYIPQIQAVLAGQSKDEILSAVRRLAHADHKVGTNRYNDVITATGPTRKDLEGNLARSSMRVLFDRHGKIKDLTASHILLQNSMEGCDAAIKSYIDELVKLSDFNVPKDNSSRVHELYSSSVVINIYYDRSECAISVTTYTGDYALALIAKKPVIEKPDRSLEPLTQTSNADTKTPYNRLVSLVARAHYCQLLTQAMYINTADKMSQKQQRIHQEAGKAFNSWKEEIEQKYPDSDANMRKFTQAYDLWSQQVRDYGAKKNVRKRVAEMHLASLDEKNCSLDLAFVHDIKTYIKEQKTVTRTSGKITVNHSRLTDRFLPQGRLLFSNDEGVYYGIYTTRFWNSIKGVDIDPHEIYLRVIAFRKPDKQGRIFKYKKVTALDRSGNTFPGFAYAQSEVDFVNKHILPAVEKTFLGRDREKHLQVSYYIQDQLFDNSNVGGYDHNIEPGRPEMPILSASFLRRKNSGPLLPAYSISPYGGQYYDLKGSKGDADKLIQSRKRLPASTKTTRRKQLEEIIAEHEDRRITPEESRICKEKISPRITYCDVRLSSRCSGLNQCARDITCSDAGPKTLGCAKSHYADKHVTGYYCYTEDNSYSSSNLDSLLYSLCDIEYTRNDDYYRDDGIMGQPIGSE